MKPLFNVELGVLNLNDQFIIKENMTVQEVEEIGIEFIREHEMNLGWFTKVANINFRDEIRYLCFDFCKNRLRKISFSLWEPTDGEDFQKTFERQNAFLKQELGEPHIIKHDIWIGYNYPWGGISSVIDIRNLSASIVMSWEKR